MGRRIVWRDRRAGNTLEWAPPLRIIAVITLFASTLDLIADFLMSFRIAEFLPVFVSDVARIAAYGYFIFTGLSVIVYVLEMTDVCLTLKNDEENVFYARLAKSLVLTVEEVPLPGLLLILFTNEPRMALANPVLIASCIKLIALSWGIVKFVKLRFVWCCLPCNPKHDRDENMRRCFQLKAYRIAMIIVNVCHALAICIVVLNIIASSQGGRPIIQREQKDVEP